jgi:hypothetical protein
MRLLFEKGTPWTAFDIIWRSFELQLGSWNIRMKNIVFQFFLSLPNLRSDHIQQEHTLVIRVTVGAAISFPFVVAPENSSKQVS